MHESTITNTTRTLSTLASLPCPRCGTIDQPSIGPGKGPHSCTGVPDNQPATPAVPVPDPRVWLEHFPAQRRSPIANFFHYPVRNGAETPAQTCSQVWQTVSHRLQMARDLATRAHLTRVLEVLQTDREGTLAYAQHVLAYEALPYEARQHVKVERSIHYLRNAMVGQSATEAQLSYLQGLGYRGEAPADRAQASALIDQLRQQRGQA